MAELSEVHWRAWRGLEYMQACGNDVAIRKDGSIMVFCGAMAVMVPIDQTQMLIREGLIELNPVVGSVYRITPAGRAALEAGE